MSRRKACESYARQFLMTLNDNCCRVNIGNTMYTLVLSILCGSSPNLTPRYLRNHGAGKKTSRWFTKYLFHFALDINLSTRSRYFEGNIWEFADKPANARQNSFTNSFTTIRSTYQVINEDINFTDKTIFLAF